MSKYHNIDSFSNEEETTATPKDNKFLAFLKTNRELVILATICVLLLVIVTTMVILIISNPVSPNVTTTAVGTTLPTPSKSTTAKSTTEAATTEEPTTETTNYTFPDSFTLASGVEEITTAVGEAVPQPETPVNPFEGDDNEELLTFETTTVTATETATEEETPTDDGGGTTKVWTMQDVMDGNCSIDEFLAQKQN